MSWNKTTNESARALKNERGRVLEEVVDEGGRHEGGAEVAQEGVESLQQVVGVRLVRDDARAEADDGRAAASARPARAAAHGVAELLGRAQLVVERFLEDAFQELREHARRERVAAQLPVDFDRRRGRRRVHLRDAFSVRVEDSTLRNSNARNVVWDLAVFPEHVPLKVITGEETMGKEMLQNCDALLKLLKKKDAKYLKKDAARADGGRGGEDGDAARDPCPQQNLFLKKYFESQEIFPVQDLDDREGPGKPALRWSSRSSIISLQDRLSRFKEFPKNRWDAASRRSTPWSEAASRAGAGSAARSASEASASPTRAPGHVSLVFETRRVSLGLSRVASRFGHDRGECF